MEYMEINCHNSLFSQTGAHGALHRLHLC